MFLSSSLRARAVFSVEFRGQPDAQFVSEGNPRGLCLCAVRPSVGALTDGQDPFAGLIFGPGDLGLWRRRAPGGMTALEGPPARPDRPHRADRRGRLTWRNCLLHPTHGLLTPARPAGGGRAISLTAPEIQPDVTRALGLGWPQVWMDLQGAPSRIVPGRLGPGAGHA